MNPYAVAKYAKLYPVPKHPRRPLPVWVRRTCPACHARLVADRHHKPACPNCTRYEPVRG